MKLNPSQHTVVTYSGLSHVLVLAGAGSGKTSVIMARVLHLIEQGVNPSRICLLTFTRRAAEEMKTRLIAKAGARANGVVVGTFHWFCLSVMRKMPNAFGIGNRSIIDQDDQESLMKMARAPEAGKDKEFPKASKLINYYSYARNTSQAPEKYLAEHTEMSEEYQAKTLNVFRGYEEKKKKNDYLDYDDLLEIFTYKCETDPRIAEQIKGLFDYILVDEFQDTNSVQFRMLYGMQGPALLMCVGDDAQSIYRFRGADFSQVHNFTKRMPNSIVMRLEVNYRSTQEILDASNWLLAESPLKYNKKMIAARGNGEMPKLLDFPDEFAEARWVATDILKRKADGGRYTDHMILVRTAYSGRAMEAILAEKNIPYRFVGGASIFAAAHVRDMLALLRVAHSHYDELAMMRFLTIWDGVGPTKATKITSGVAAVPTPEEAEAIVAKMLPKAPQVAETIRRVRGLKNDPQNAILEAQKCLEPILSLKYEHWDARVKDYALLAKLAVDHPSIHAFIETYTLDPVTTSTIEAGEQQDFVTLITDHSSKGTEAPVVYLIQAQEGMYPHVRSLGDFDAEEEERRILYVALTRAMNLLFITRTYGGGGFYGGKLPSRPRNGYFLEFLPPEMVDTELHGYAAPKSYFGGLRDF